MIYVTADIHGYYEAFLKLLQEIQFTAEDYLYVIGDTIDKGPESFQVLEHIMQAENMELILGNHEEFLLEALKSRVYGKRNFIDMELWCKHGGEKTFEEFMQMPLKKQQDIFQHCFTHAQPVQHKYNRQKSRQKNHGIDTHSKTPILFAARSTLGTAI